MDVRSAEELRGRYRGPSERALQKVLDRLDEHCRRFVELSPFCVLATSGRDGPADRFLAAAHVAAALGRLAPYLERDCMRSFTPAASSVPRMMW